MTDTIETKSGFYGWKNVALLFGIYLSAFGLVFYGFSVIFPAMIIAMEWNRGTASIGHTISVLLMGVIVPLVAVSINKIGAKKTIAIGCALLLLGLLFMGTVMTSIYQWIVVWGLLIGTAFAFCGVIPIQTTLMHWFNVKRATAIGLVMTGAAVGGVLAQPFYTWVMGVVESWRIGWIIGAIFALTGLILSFFLVNKPDEVGQHPDGLTPEQMADALNQAGGGAKTYRTKKTWEVNTVFKNPIIYFIAVVMIGHLMSLFLITSHGILHFMDKGFAQMQAASIMSFVILGSGIARFPAGWLGDRIEPRWILTATFIIQLIAYMGIWKSTNLQIVMGSGALFGFCYGCQLIMFPTLLGNYYGPEAFPGINGIIAPIMILFGAAVPMGAGYIYETFGSYDGAFIIMMSMLGVSLILSLLMTPPKKAEEA